MDSMKAEKLKLGETMVRATPSKKEGQLKDQLNKTEQQSKECKEKLEEDEAKICELKSELNNLQKQMDVKISQHEKEINRTASASQKVILELKETNKDLLDGINGEKSIGRESVKSKISVSPPRVEDASPTLEADDSKTDVSLVEHTPVVKKTGRGRGKGRVNRSTRSQASLASF